MTIPAFIIISGATFVVAFICSISTSQPQKEYPVAKHPKWVESTRLAFFITAGVGAALTGLTIIAAVALAI